MEIASLDRRDVPAVDDLHFRSQLLRRVAHDIASPAGVMSTVLDELASCDGVRPELVAMARRSLRRLMRLSEQLALVGELEAAPLEPDRVRLDLRSVARRAVADAVAIDGRKDVRVHFEAAAEALPVWGEARLLESALREIVGNALKLASSAVEVSAGARGDRTFVRVDDDGPGFSDEAVAKLGQRFVARTSSRGLGLSLSMAIEILRAHDGALDLEPSTLPPGARGSRGAAVVVSLPIAR